MATFELKERGHHYQEEGKNVLNLIISQMNNRLSSNQDENYPVIDREQLYLKINQLLNGPSNIEVKEDGRLFIKSLNRLKSPGPDLPNCPGTSCRRTRNRIAARPRKPPLASPLMLRSYLHKPWDLERMA